MSRSVLQTACGFLCLLCVLSACGGARTVDVERPDRERYEGPVESLRIDILPQFDRRGPEALGRDAQGRLFVVDTRRRSILVHPAPEDTVRVMQTAGFGFGGLDSPVDVDPSQGLTVLVADAGRRVVVRFDARFQPISELPVTTAHDPVGAAPRFLLDDESENSLPDGVPMAVALARTNEIYVLEQRSRSVLQWDAQQRPVRRFGGIGMRSLPFVRPVDLAVAGERVWVADDALDVVVSYDLEGAWQHTFVVPDNLGNPVALVAQPPFELWVLTDRHLLRVEEQRLNSVWSHRLAQPSDVLIAGDTVWVAHGDGVSRGLLER